MRRFRSRTSATTPRVSLGINEDGHTEGQIMGVFARNNERAAVGQLWWDRSGAGGIQGDFNWLWGMNALQAREHPDEATVARLSFAVDQNSDHDRKATVGFGIERRAFSIEAYLAGGITGARRSDTTLANAALDDQRHRRDRRLHASADHDDRNDLRPPSVRQRDRARGESFFREHRDAPARRLRFPERQRRRALEHACRSASTRRSARAAGDFRRSPSTSANTAASTATRATIALAVFLRYEFGSHGSFVPTSQLEDPAWISRSLARPSSAHPRIVESYRTQKTQNVTTTRGAKQYTNHFPIAQNDTATVTDGTSATIPVLANDSDPDGDPLILTAVTAPAHGVAAIAGTMIVYTPAVGFSGTDTFGYTISDGHGGSASANVSVGVAAQPNRPPRAVNDSASTTFGRPVTISVLANDTDPDGNSLTIASVTQPVGGSVAINGSTLVFTPTAGFSGTARFTYTIDDGHGGTATASVSVFVAARPNRAPVAADDAATTTFNTAVTINVLANDSDPDGDSLSISADHAAGERHRDDQRRGHRLHAGCRILRRRSLHVHDQRRPRRRGDREHHRHGDAATESSAGCGRRRCNRQPPARRSRSMYSRTTAIPTAMR